FLQTGPCVSQNYATLRGLTCQFTSQIVTIPAATKMRGRRSRPLGGSLLGYIETAGSAARSGRGSLIEDFGSLAGISNSEEKNRFILFWFHPGIGKVDVDLGVAELLRRPRQFPY